MAALIVPQVYPAMLEVLKSMAVEKGGQLPANMGGKDYITAPDLSAETKRQFVKNNLIVLPHEKTVSQESVTTTQGDRVKVTNIVVIEGTYVIVSTVDGSMAEISGVGDGMATGTSVASNIASTNAMKNALMRTFLITEQSVEDQAKGDNQPQGAAQVHRGW
jgi:hypothetical protein